MRNSIKWIPEKTKVRCPNTGKNEDAIMYLSPKNLRNIYPQVIYTTCENANFCRFEKCEYKQE